MTSPLTPVNTQHLTRDLMKLQSKSLTNKRDIPSVLYKVGIGTVYLDGTLSGYSGPQSSGL